MFGPIASVRDGKNQTVEYIKHLDKEKSQYENGRLLYVAATRARKHLHLIGHTDVDSKKDEVKAPSESTLLFQFWPVVKRASWRRTNSAQMLLTSTASLKL